MCGIAYLQPITKPLRFAATSRFEDRHVEVHDLHVSLGGGKGLGGMNGTGRGPVNRRIAFQYSSSKRCALDIDPDILRELQLLPTGNPAVVPRPCLFALCGRAQVECEFENPVVSGCDQPRSQAPAIGTEIRNGRVNGFNTFGFQTFS